MFYKFSILLAVASISMKSTTAVTDKVICYYESWASNYAPEDIDIDICTHINYSFFGVNKDDGTLRSDGNEDIIRRVSDLKKINPNLKVLFSVGGWGEDPVGFSTIAADDLKKLAMAQSALYLVSKYNYDGIDIDWEYPAMRGGIPEDKENFVDMLRVLRQTLGDRILSLAVWSVATIASYDIPAITETVDFINLMTYDLHHAEDGKTGQNSPLYGSSSDTPWEADHSNCNSSVNNWLKGGAVQEKIMLGLGFYGKTYQLANPDNHDVGAPVLGAGNAGGSYAQICELDDGWTDVWDDVQKNPYKYKGDQWIGYDNPRSIREKVLFAKNRNLGGVMMWAVDQDDKNGICGAPNGLLQEIKNNL